MTRPALTMAGFSFTIAGCCLLFLLQASSSWKCAPCRSPWVYYEGHCYHTVAVRTSQVNAHRECRAMSRVGTPSHLVSIHSQAELNYVGALIRSVTGSTGRFWIGLRWERTNDTFTWLDGSPDGGFRNWLPDEPNNQGGENCTELSVYHSLQWNDLSCNSDLDGYVCKTLPRAFEWM